MYGNVVVRLSSLGLLKLEYALSPQGFGRNTY